MDDNKLNRRDMLRVTAAGGAGLIAAGAVPAMAQDKQPELDLPTGTSGKLTVIHRTEYFPEAQDYFRASVVDFAADHKVELDISTTNPESFGDFIGKVTAAVKAGNPPDFAMHGNVSIPQLHALDLVEDVTDVVEEAISKYGELMPGMAAQRNGFHDGKWKAIPYTGSSLGYYFRSDKLAEKGIDGDSLTTWDQRREAALAISDPANGFYGWGFTINKGGDGNDFCISVVNSFGGHYTDESGTKVTFNSPETVAAFEWLVETYDRNGKYAAMIPPGVESWTDTGNNEAWAAGQIGHTLNAWSVYAASKKNSPDDLFKKIKMVNAPTFNNGESRDGGGVGGWLTIFKGAPNVDLAKELALYLLNPENFNKISTIAAGLFMPAYKNLWTPELLAVDPNYAIIQKQLSVETPHLFRTWPANPAPQIDAIRAQSVLENAVGNAVSGRMSAADAVADAHAKIVEIFEEGGLPQ
jgi:multiple sugar transport system substrate-binding protein